MSEPAPSPALPIIHLARSGSARRVPRRMSWRSQPAARRRRFRNRPLRSRRQASEPSQRPRAAMAGVRPALGVPKEESDPPGNFFAPGARAAPGAVWCVPKGEAGQAAIGGKLRALGTAAECRASCLCVPSHFTRLADLKPGGGGVAVAYGLDKALGSWLN